CLDERLTRDRGRRTASLGTIHSPLGIPDVETTHVELKRLGVMLTDAVHHQLVLRDELAARVAGRAIGHTAEDLRTLVAGKGTASKLPPDRKAQRLLGHHRGFSC